MEHKSHTMYTLPNIIALEQFTWNQPGNLYKKSHEPAIQVPNKNKAELSPLDIVSVSDSLPFFHYS